jgi:Ca-activated chloride channel family protein
MRTLHFLGLLALSTALLSSCYKESGIYTNSGLVADYAGNVGGERYNEIEENPFIATADEPISTFSVDADGASYANSRRFIQDNQQPPADAIRTEEFINYFPFDYAPPTGSDPIGLNGEVSDCPWAPGHKLMRIGIQGKELPRSQQGHSNFVLLVDVSGSMNSRDKLGILKDAFHLFVDEMRASDRLAIVTYAGADKVALTSTPGTDKKKIRKAIDKLTSGGGTAGAAGITTAYEIAAENFIEGGNNRIILGTDGDFNIGISDQDELIELIEEKRESGVFLSVLGVGAGNLNEGMMEQLANNGNGNFEYLDSEEEARKVMVEQFSKFYTVAKDVKVQIEFNSSLVEQYRLIGYENRLLEENEFEDDSVDGGEIGANQSITALYEVIPVPNVNYKSGPSFTVDFRYKKPDEDFSQALMLQVVDQEISFDKASENQRFAAAAAGFALVMRDSEHKGSLTYDKVIDWAQDARTFDPFGYRERMIDLVKDAKKL